MERVSTVGVALHGGSKHISLAFGVQGTKHGVHARRRRRADSLILSSAKAARSTDAKCCGLLEVSRPAQPLVVFLHATQKTLRACQQAGALSWWWFGMGGFLDGLARSRSR